MVYEHLPVTKAIADRSANIKLSSSELARFNRHILLPQLGIKGQMRLKAAKVLVVGAGGLGSPALLYLAAAGMGTLGIADFDEIEISNLQRQILYTTNDRGNSKLNVAIAHISRLNPDCALFAHSEAVTPDNCLSILAPYDIILDGTDNFASRYLIHDHCVFLKKPYIYGSIFRFEGQASVFYPPFGPCYRCLFPSPPRPPQTIPNCTEAGVLGVLPGHIGTLQALETLKLAAGFGTPLIGRIHIWDALKGSSSEFRLKADPSCPLCHHELTNLDAFTEDYSFAICHNNQGAEINARDLGLKLRQSRSLLLIDVRQKHEAEKECIEGSVNIPLNELPERLEELMTFNFQETVVYCQTGKRSLEALKMLKNAGFQKVQTLKDGIVSWFFESENGTTKQFSSQEENS